MIGIQVAGAAAREQYSYRLATNDPAHPLITFNLIADIKPVPEVYRRIQNANFVNGQRVESFEVWPTAQPFIMMEKGERLTIPLRVRPSQINAHLATVTTEDIQSKKAVAPDSIPKVKEGGDPPFPGSVNYRIRPDVNQRGFWIDIELSGVDRSGQFAWSANVTDPATGESFPIGLGALVLEENLILNPKSLNSPVLSLGSLKATPVVAAQLNLRKMIGSIHITGVSSTLEFVKGSVQVLVDGRNYLVKAYVIANPGVDPGRYQGSIKIDTDDPAHRQIEVPFGVTFTP